VIDSSTGGVLITQTPTDATIRTRRGLFKGRHFDQEIVVLCVRWYVSLKLSYRDLVAMMGERGISLAHTRFCAGYGTIARSLQSAGTATPGRWAAPGGVTKPILR
jgi:hypothetical protein